MTKALTINGADISHWQGGGEDFGKAYNAGVRLFLHKATEGKTYVDPMYAKRMVEAIKEAPLMARGAYHFAQPAVGSAVDEAKHFLSVARLGEGNVRAVLDLEKRNGLSDKELDLWVKNWTDVIWDALGWRAMIYTPFDLLSNHYCRLWVARYSNDNAAPHIPKPWKNYSLRQFSNGVYGVPNNVAGMGHVDLNTLDGGMAKLEDLVMSKGAPPAPKPVPKPAKQTLDFRVHLVPGNKVESQAKVISDMHLAAGKSGRDAVVYNTERETAVLRQAVKDGLGTGWTTMFDNECVMGIAADWHQAPHHSGPASIVLAADDPYMAGVSPTRRLNRFFGECSDFNGHTIAHLSTHMVSEPWCTHDAIKGKAWRVATWKKQWADIKGEMTRLHKLDLPIIFVGDLNTGVRFNGDKVMADLVALFGKDVTHVHNGGLDHIFTISSKSVVLSEVGKEVETNNASDHNMVSATIRATER